MSDTCDSGRLPRMKHAAVLNPDRGTVAASRGHVARDIPTGMPTLKRNVTTMSNDTTMQDRLAAQEARLAADAATLADHAEAIALAITQWRTRRDDRTADAIALPVAALLKNRGNTAAWDAAVAAVQHHVDAETLTALVAVAENINAALATRLEYAAAVEATALAAALRPMVGNAYLPFDPDVMAAVTGAVAAYDLAEAEYKKALAEQSQRDNPAAQYRGSRGGRGRGPNAGGQWQAEHGWYFTATCDICHAAVTSRSNVGSFQNDMAKHAGSHRGVERVYAQDINAENRAIHEGFTNAMYAVADGAVAADGGTFHIAQTRDVVAA